MPPSFSGLGYHGLTRPGGREMELLAWRSGSELKGGGTVCFPHSAHRISPNMGTVHI